MGLLVPDSLGDAPVAANEPNGRSGRIRIGGVMDTLLSLGSNGLAGLRNLAGCEKSAKGIIAESQGLPLPLNGGERSALLFIRFGASFEFGFKPCAWSILGMRGSRGVASGKDVSF